MERISLLLSGILGFLGVTFGAFGAHGLKNWAQKQADGEQRVAWWQTAAQYHLVHALAIALGALRPTPMTTGSSVAPWLFLGGILLFSGSLYVMALTGYRKLGAITPLGGLFFLAGWLAITYNAFVAG
ncbi:MAG TPA: DUF423 domain-containing protein [Polyangium sp.]|nr:DUF423 domain-containing protein [Polyangium sp.]